MQEQIGGLSSEIERTKPLVPTKKYVVGTGAVQNRTESDTDY